MTSGLGERDDPADLADPTGYVQLMGYKDDLGNPRVREAWRLTPPPAAQTVRLTEGPQGRPTPAWGTWIMLLKKNWPPGQAPRSRGRWVLAATILVALLSAGCAAPAPSTADGSTDAAPALPRVGRNACPGSVPQVARQVGGAAADALEQLQGTYENEPGFLGVVHDGRKPVIVVELRRLLEWQARMTPLGIAVARSCVDPGLLASVQAALLRLSQGQDGIMSAGYDVLDDAISVLGVDPDVLMSTMDEIRRGSGSSALAAIEDGTLRINPAKISDSR